VKGAKTGFRAVFAALGANLGVAAVKFAAFLLTGSASMLAESLHSLADSGNQVLLLVGRSRAARAQTEEHPFGFGRERYFYTFLVAVVLFTVGSMFSFYDGVHKVLHPEPVSDAYVAFGVLAAAACLEGFSMHTGVTESNRVRDGLGWVAFIRQAKIPELPAVLLEDASDLVGLACAFTGIGLAAVTGDGVWDGVGSIGVGAVLACVAAILATEMKSLLIGESAGADIERRIVAALAGSPEVQRVIHLRTTHLGPESLLVAAKIAVRGDEPAGRLARGIDAAERRVRAAVPIAEVIYLEPDVYQEARVHLAHPAIRAARRSWRGRAGGGGDSRGDQREPRPRAD
jgi:cation diffusion facilitator family transporter